MFGLVTHGRSGPLLAKGTNPLRYKPCATGLPTVSMLIGRWRFATGMRPVSPGLTYQLPTHLRDIKPLRLLSKL